MATPAGFTQTNNGFFAKTSDGSGPYSVDQGGNALLMGGRASDPLGTGSLFTLNYASAAAIIDTTPVVVRAAPGAGLRCYITSFQIQNSSATGTEFLIRNTAGAVLWRGYIPAASSLSVPLTNPIVALVNNAVEVVCLTTATATYFNMQGYVAP